MNCARARTAALWLVPSLLLACNTAGSAWMAQPLDESHPELPPGFAEQHPLAGTPSAPPPRAIRTLGDGSASPGADAGDGPPGSGVANAGGGRPLGVFKNTYYDFPNEREFTGESQKLMSASCRVIAEVKRGFYESVCVQGSGTLESGQTVSFAKRDCACAAICPRSGQRICFEALPAQSFPWGRGATGKAITPLVTVAVDSQLIPLGTPLYIPEYRGLPKPEGGVHDGCFVAEDRGLAVQGSHVDVFTGAPSTTTLWNRLVPTNQGVTVIVGSSYCLARNP